MTSANSRRRRDVKTQDREKSLSPLDKDHLKQRCLERVRSERRRLMARMRERRALGGDEFADGETTAVNPLEADAAATAGAGNHSSPLGYSLLSAREILKHGLNEIAGGNRRSREQPYPQHEAATAASGQTGEQNPSWSVSRNPDPQRQPPPGPHDKPQGESHGESQSESQSQSHLTALAEEAAYLNACSGGRCTGTPQRPAAAAGGGMAGTPSSAAAGHPLFTPGSRNFDREYQLYAGVAGGQHTPDKVEVAKELEATPMTAMTMTAMTDGDDWWDGGSDISDEERLLSPEEYLEMMQYIEELCREEDLRAEAEVSYGIPGTVYDSLRRLCVCFGDVEVTRFYV